MQGMYLQDKNLKLENLKTLKLFGSMKWLKEDRLQEMALHSELKKDTWLNSKYSKSCDI